MRSTIKPRSIALLFAAITILVSGPAARSQRKQERAFRGSDPDHGSSLNHRRSRPPGKPVLALNLPAAAASRLIFHDPLTTGTTAGTRDNGQGVFVPGGWKVTSPSDNIRYTSPLPIEEGAVEFDVTGLQFDDTRPQNHRGQLMSGITGSFPAAISARKSKRSFARPKPSSCAGAGCRWAQNGCGRFRFGPG